MDRGDCNTKQNDIKSSQKKKRQKRSVCSHQSTSQRDNRSVKGSKIESIQNESSVEADNSSLNGCVYGNQNSNKSADLAKTKSQRRNRN